MEMRNYDPQRGQAYQGDVSIVPVPAGITISTLNEIKPVNGKLILQEGEITGHHHHIALRERHFKPAREVGDPVLNVRDTTLRKKFGGARKLTQAQLATVIAETGAKMFRDPAAVQVMAATPVPDLEGGMTPVLTRTDLAVGFLFIPPSPEIVGHQEHDGIRVMGGDGTVVTPAEGYAFQAGRYFIGGQVESAGAEERRVVD